MKRIVWFSRLVLRPHPYAYPGMPLWQAWTIALVWPSEAWRLAGLYSKIP